MEFLIVYALFCLLVGWGYSNTTWGFGGGFLISILLSPIIGFIVMFFVPNKKDDSMQNQIMLNQQQLLQQQINQSKPQRSLTDELTKLENLKDKSLITIAEFSSMREKLMQEFA